jgi:hypothetical protein
VTTGIHVQLVNNVSSIRLADQAFVFVAKDMFVIRKAVFVETLMIVRKIKKKLHAD